MCRGTELVSWTRVSAKAEGFIEGLRVTVAETERKTKRDKKNRA